MLAYKKILFPADLSEMSAKLVPHLISMAEKFDSEICLVYVAEVNEYHVYGEEPGESVKKQIQEYKETYLKDVEKVKIIAAEGEAADEILNIIESEDADMVLMATRGRKALDKAVFGSVAGSVLRSSPVPVFFVNPFKDKFIN